MKFMEAFAIVTFHLSQMMKLAFPVVGFGLIFGSIATYYACEGCYDWSMPESASMLGFIFLVFWIPCQMLANTLPEDRFDERALRPFYFALPVLLVLLLAAGWLSWIILTY